MNRLPEATLQAQIEKEKNRVKTYKAQLKTTTDVSHREILKSLIGGCQHRSKRAARLLACKSAAEQLRASERLSEPL
jgi:uncharacterized membrane-anchored protein YhcB (DUF1043 family)